ncbi:hypothetical protein C8035_v006505 [Colletotrichum spinosum]|uniref:Uncharacterized protein n=1 Tax=Colletotrichum spinosum TaxID=1347390 RepID=A0A4R8PU21_9PEZI|nr:hypothetical protein C8035_v006505 [Colletotrichum spinosum]
MNIDLIKAVNNYKNYNNCYKGLKGLALYKSDFTTPLSLFKVTIAIFSFNMLLEEKAISRV